MGWRFRKRIKIFPGFHINISKRGISANVGVRGANVTFGPDGTYVNTGFPGTGLYRRDKVSEANKEDVIVPHEGNRYACLWSFIKKMFSKPKHKDYESSSQAKEETEQIVDDSEKSKVDSTKEDETGKTASLSNNTKSITAKEPQAIHHNQYRLPSTYLLFNYDEKTSFNFDVIRENNDRLVGLLNDFGIKVSHISATIGPRDTIYEIVLVDGQRISDLYNFEEDIALAFNVAHVNISPIPGRGTIGIEIPHLKPHVVHISNLLKSDLYKNTKMDLPCAIGKTMTNEVFMFDLEAARNVLIAGATGQGKSNLLDVIITSLLYKKSPLELKLILMDPYGVEFGMYAPLKNIYLADIQGAPSIVTNGEEAITSLEALCQEMDNRYSKFATSCVRSIKEYNTKCASKGDGKALMPYIVVIIDSYSVLAAGYQDSMERLIKRLLNNARPTGIHVIISTKRPSSDIISSEIKSYIPTRISFRLPERIDSQLILDCNGAEKLEGPGDMLYINGCNPIHVQCALITTAEIKNVVTFVSAQTPFDDVTKAKNAGPLENIPTISKMVDISNFDSLFEQAARIVVMTQQGSSSMIQRRFSIGYNRVGRIMDQLELAGIVGPAHGSKPRDVLISDENSLNKILLQWRSTSNDKSKVK